MPALLTWFLGNLLAWTGEEWSCVVKKGARYKGIRSQNDRPIYKISWAQGSALCVTGSVFDIAWM